MIRIETTAEFDTEGRFTLQGQILVPVTPGTHRVTIELENADSESLTDASEPPTRKVGNVLVFTGQMLEDPETVRQRLDAESVNRALQGPFE